jgi:CYTH domain-containing protein
MLVNKYQKGNKMQKPEIERRFVLKRIPIVKFDHIYDIRQYYIQDGDLVKRLRYQFDTVWNSDKKSTLEYLHKIQTGHGQFIEVLEDVTMDQYHDLIKKAFKRLTKKRYVHECNGLKFEIDSIDGIELVMLEVELEHIDQPITFPDEIAKQIVGEVTGIKGFSNFALAIEQ